MCDCYYHKCEICDNTVPIHISDFDYPRSDFKVWCYQHIEHASPGSTMFEITEVHEVDIADPDYPNLDVWVGWKCAILGPEVGIRNTPNLASEWVTAIVGGNI